MPLKIRVKPEAKIYAGGAVLKNVGTRAAELLILSDGPVLRQDFMMNPEQQNDSDANSVYFLLQMLYLFKGKGQPLDNLVIETLKSFAKLHGHLEGDVEQIISHLHGGDAFKALKIGHGMMDKLDAAIKGEPKAASPQNTTEEIVKA